MLKRLVLVLEVISILIFLIMIFAIQLDLANNLKWRGDSHLFPLLAKHDYPPVEHDEVYKEIFEQAENFKIHQQHSMA